MPELSPEWIAKTLGAKWSAPVAQNFSSVSVDSREIKPGALFVGVKTPTGHRQDYIAAAQKSGAIAAIVEKLQDSPLPQLVVADSTAALQKIAAAKRAQYTGTVIGLTGSSGKTSTKELLAHLLGPSTHKTSGNLNNHLGVPLTILHADVNAPHWVLEAGISNINEMNPLAEMIKPDAALITLVGSAHLEFLKTPAGIAEEKGKLLHAVKPEGICVLHAREVLHKPLQNLKAKVFVLAEKNASLPPLPKNYEILSLELSPDKKNWRMKLGATLYILPLWTPGMAQNAALCLTLAEKLGISTKLLQERLNSWTGVALRGEWLKVTAGKPQTRVYLDAYNSNPEALRDSLWRFTQMSRAPHKLYIIGSMGELGENSDAQHRQAVQSLPVTQNDTLIFVGSKAPLMAEEAQCLKTKPKSISVAKNIDEIKSMLADFDGDCFIKGSHSTNLHTLSASCSPI